MEEISSGTPGITGNETEESRVRCPGSCGQTSEIPVERKEESYFNDWWEEYWGFDAGLTDKCDCGPGECKNSC